MLNIHAGIDAAWPDRLSVLPVCSLVEGGGDNQSRTARQSAQLLLDEVNTARVNEGHAEQRLVGSVEGLAHGAEGCQKFTSSSGCLSLRKVNQEKSVVAT